jgi:hypothetical protein
MTYEVKLWLGGRTFIEEVFANNAQEARDTAKARNPFARVVSINALFD